MLLLLSLLLLRLVIHQSLHHLTTKSKEQFVFSHLNEAVPVHCSRTYPPCVQVGPAAMRPTCAFELVLFAAYLTGAGAAAERQPLFEGTLRAVRGRKSQRSFGLTKQILGMIAGKDKPAPALFLLFALLLQFIVLLS